MYLLTCAPNEDTDQPAHPRSLIRVFVVRMKKPCFLAIQNAPNEDSDQTARKRRLVWILAWRTCQTVRFLTLRLKWRFVIEQLIQLVPVWRPNGPCTMSLSWKGVKLTSLIALQIMFGKRWGCSAIHMHIYARLPCFQHLLVFVFWVAFYTEVNAQIYVMIQCKTFCRNYLCNKSCILFSSFINK